MYGSASGLPTGTSTAGATAGTKAGSGEEAEGDPASGTGAPVAMEITPGALQGRV